MLIYFCLLVIIYILNITNLIIFIVNILTCFTVFFAHRNVQEFSNSSNLINYKAVSLSHII